MNNKEWPEDIGLSIDMIDADRLRDWAHLILFKGAEVRHLGGLTFVASRMEAIADGIEKAVRDIGVMRGDGPKL